MSLHTMEGLAIYQYYQQLQDEGKKTIALKLIEEFYEMYDDDSDQSGLWFIVSLALKSKNEEIDAPERSDILFYYECLRLLLFATKAMIKYKKE